MLLIAQVYLSSPYGLLSVRRSRSSCWGVCLGSVRTATLVASVTGDRTLMDDTARTLEEMDSALVETAWQASGVNDRGRCTSDRVRRDCRDWVCWRSLWL